MLERQLREQQRIVQELHQQIQSLTETLQATTTCLTSKLVQLNQHLARFATTPSTTQLMPLADFVESTSAAQHTRLVQLETSILKVLTTLNAQSEQLKSFGSIAISLQESLPPAKKKDRPSVQWNCRNLCNNKTPLHQYLFTHHFLPHFLLIQEARATSAIPGYRAYHATTSTPLASIYVRGDMLVEPLDIPCTLLKYLVGVVYYDPCSQISLALPSFYTLPVTSSLFRALVKFLHSLPSTTYLIIGGDFNAPHTLSGYPQTPKPGRLLHCLVQ
ncbi:hypothetical protein HPB48_015920 [Haemaphysalis longicornis]|uniref:Endonuclease/exonuclease/phosphatase domain-containing protein n=1 Tax=Haemaphysalis longicornis TaxID=44386 RepID=A0A9J6GWU2_HAELO|nr:hypothetical protein HPB48_015920 [Haemaphysalis longicornis]